MQPGFPLKWWLKWSLLRGDSFIFGGVDLNTSFFWCLSQNSVGKLWRTSLTKPTFFFWRSSGVKPYRWSEPGKSKNLIPGRSPNFVAVTLWFTWLSQLEESRMFAKHPEKGYNTVSLSWWPLLAPPNNYTSNPHLSLAEINGSNPTKTPFHLEPMVVDEPNNICTWKLVVSACKNICFMCGFHVFFTWGMVGHHHFHPWNMLVVYIAPGWTSSLISCRPFVAVPANFWWPPYETLPIPST